MRPHLPNPLNGNVVPKNLISHLKFYLPDPLDEVNKLGGFLSFLKFIPASGWAAITGVAFIGSICSLASICNCATFLAHEDPFFGPTTIKQYIKLDLLKKQYQGKPQLPPVFSLSKVPFFSQLPDFPKRNREESSKYFEIEVTHAYMFFEDPTYFWAIQDLTPLGLFPGQIGKCKRILNNEMLLLRFNKLVAGALSME